MDDTVNLVAATDHENDLKSLVTDILQRAQQERRRRGGSVGERRRRTLGHGSPRRTRDRGVQSRSRLRHHGLFRQAQRIREHVGFDARGGRGDGAGGVQHRAVHRRRSVSRSRRHISHGAGVPGSRSRPSVDHVGRRRRSDGAGRGVGRARLTTGASRTPTARRWARSASVASTATATASSAATSRTRHSISCGVISDDGNGMERDYYYTHRQIDRRSRRSRRASAPKRRAARWRGSVRGRSRRDAIRCCFRPKSRAASSVI